jgi:hypothetical protein
MCVYKFNNGNGAILCSNCGAIIATGHDCKKKEYVDAMNDGTPVFCSDECEIEWNNDIDEFDNGEYYR